ncbi:hypothetical protein QAD02_011304 [Eretmocerus hayati]|uniref:Uncharacterized protein n=1 Tax=Eretmocerus hayati TaxID=131215 RepID=A0ACC2NWD1_9HYME|nr:hypothetical protein QAD02_011304 [Eretmocerus hayati]
MLDAAPRVMHLLSAAAYAKTVVFGLLLHHPKITTPPQRQASPQHGHQLDHVPLHDDESSLLAKFVVDRLPVAPGVRSSHELQRAPSRAPRSMPCLSAPGSDDTAESHPA